MAVWIYSIGVFMPHASRGVQRAGTCFRTDNGADIGMQDVSRLFPVPRADSVAYRAGIRNGSQLLARGTSGLRADPVAGEAWRIPPRANPGAAGDSRLPIATAPVSGLHFFLAVARGLQCPARTGGCAAELLFQVQCWGRRVGAPMPIRRCPRACGQRNSPDIASRIYCIAEAVMLKIHQPPGIGGQVALLRAGRQLARPKRD